MANSVPIALIWFSRVRRFWVVPPPYIEPRNDWLSWGIGERARSITLPMRDFAMSVVHLPLKDQETHAGHEQPGKQAVAEGCGVDEAQPEDPIGVLTDVGGRRSCVLSHL